jgi:5-methyltetrahydrofolate--homocysteine methyltransferase
MQTQQNYSILAKAVQEGQADRVTKAVRQAVKAGLRPQDILEKGLLQGIAMVGEKFRYNEIFVPEVLIATRAFKSGVTVLKSELGVSNIEPLGIAVIATVAGDVHDIGKNLVAMMIESVGFQVVDLGTDVAADQIVRTIQDSGARYVLLSSLLTITMLNIAVVVEALKEAGLRNQVVVMVGGAPLSQSFCEWAGADLYAEDCYAAARLLKERALGQIAEGAGIKNSVRPINYTRRYEKNG